MNSQIPTEDDDGDEICPSTLNYESDGTLDYVACIKHAKFSSVKGLNTHATKEHEKSLGKENVNNISRIEDAKHVSATGNSSFEQNKQKNKCESEKNDKKCEFCNKIFRRRCDMLRHRREQHIERWEQPSFKVRRRKVDIEYKIFCNVCNLGFTRRNDMIKHRTMKHPWEQMNDVQLSNNLEHRSKQMDCEQRRIEEEQQSKTPLNGQHLYHHSHGGKTYFAESKKRKRRKREDIVATFFCGVCSKGFTRKFDMQKHQKLKHAGVELPPDEEVVTSKRKQNLEYLSRCRVSDVDDKKYYKCETCDKVFHHSYNFMRHQTIHTGVRAYFCHICGKNFRISSGLSRHLSALHYGVKNFKCEICGRKFSARASLNDHVNIHTNNRPFVCDICGKCYKQKATLHIHKTFHTNVFRYSCNVCGKRFRRTSDLKTHSWLHTGDKPYHCHICASTFRLSQDLKRHLSVHEKMDGKVWTCAECGATFNQERCLKIHKKTHMND